MRPTSLFLLGGAAGLTGLVSGQTVTTLTSTETGSVSTITSATTVFPSPTGTTTTAAPVTTSPTITTASVVPTNGAGSHAAGLDGPLAGLVVFAIMAVGLV